MMARFLLQNALEGNVFTGIREMYFICFCPKETKHQIVSKDN